MSNTQLNGFGSFKPATLHGTLALSGLLLLTGCVSTVHLPQSLVVPANQKVWLHAYVKGVEIYRCQADPHDVGHHAWAHQATEAMMFDELGNVIGSHYSGPTWESDLDGSTITGELLQSSPSPNSRASPWLLFGAKPHGPPGRFHYVTYILCVNTSGGAAPAGGTEAAQFGEQIRVRYTAEHIFYREAKRSKLFPRTQNYEPAR